MLRYILPPSQFSQHNFLQLYKMELEEAERTNDPTTVYLLKLLIKDVKEAIQKPKTQKAA